MQTVQPARSIRRAVIVMAGVACALIAAWPGHGATDTGVLMLDLDERASRRLDDLERGELKITWREDGPVLAIGELGTPTDSGRRHEKGSAAPPIADCFLLAAFDYTTRNRLGGGNRLAGRAKAELVIADPETRRRALRFEFEQGPVTPRIELSLYDGDPVRETVFYLDGRQFDYFDLRVRGAGDDRVTATLVDAHGRSVDVGTVSLSDDPSLANEWRSLRLATDVETIHRHHLARLELRGHGSGSLEIDDMYLCRDGAAPERDRPRRQSTINSLWVWHTSDLLAAGSKGVGDLTDLARQVNVGRIYLQVPGSLDEAATQRALQTVASQIAAAGIELFALDGAPEYALPSEHDDLLDTMSDVIGYNRAVPPEARFVGVHLDVEPYLLDGWEESREEIVTGYIGMLDAVRSRTAKEGLELDVAVPFWFDSIAVHRQGGDRAQRVALTDEVLGRVDSIAVMDYRTETSGSNGVLALGAVELAAAAEHGRDVWIGLETTWLPNQTLVRFRGAALAGRPDSEAQEWWVVETPHALWVARGDALDELVDRLQGIDVADTRHWPAHAVEVPASRQTFYDLGFEALLQAMSDTSVQLDGHPAFAGFALHYDRPLRRLLDAASE